MQLQKKLKLPRASVVMQSNTKPLPEKVYFILFEQGKKLNEVHFYGSHVRQNQENCEGKLARYSCEKDKCSQPFEISNWLSSFEV